MALNHFHGMGQAVFRPKALTEGSGTPRTAAAQWCDR